MRAATRVNVEQASKRATRRPTRRITGQAATGREASDARTGRLRRGNDGGTHGRGGWWQHGKPWRWRGTRQPEPREGQAGPAGWRRGPQYRGSRVMPMEGRGLRCGGTREGRTPAGVALPGTPRSWRRARSASHAEAKESNPIGSMSSRREQARRRIGDDAGGRMAVVQRPRLAGSPALSALRCAGGPCARRMIPLESPVPEIGTPGSVSGDWKRGHGSRTEARCESAGQATGP